MDDQIFSDIRIWRATGDVPVGVGFVSSPKFLMTCAHVVADALGNRRLAVSSEKPHDEIEIDFPALASSGSRESRRALVHTWWPMHGPSPDDVAILELKAAVPSAIRPIIACRGYKPDDRIRAFGLRASLPNGAFVAGRFLGEVAGARLQIISDAEDTALRQGCSGAAVWNTTRGGVMGMVVAAQLNLSGLLTSIEALSKLHLDATGEPIGYVSGQPVVVTEDVLGGDVDEATRVKALASIPGGPGIDPFEIKPNIKRAFAGGTNPVSAAAVLGDAGRLVIASLDRPPKNRAAYVCAPMDFGDPQKMGMLNYWSTVFDHACMLGPRMVGALLLAAPPTVVTGAKQDITELFEKLGAMR
jgi:hypothetical protein